MAMIDELKREVEQLQRDFRRNELRDVVSRFEFRDGAARQDFTTLLRGNVLAKGPSFECPDGLSLREFAHLGEHPNPAIGDQLKTGQR